MPEVVEAQSAVRRVLWAASLRTKSLDERLAAAQAGGFDHMSVFPIDWRTWRGQELTGARTGLCGSWAALSRL